MDKVNEVIDDLGLREFGDFDGNIFIVDIQDSDTFSSIYTDISDKYDPEDDNNEFNDDSSVTTFITDGVESIATANYDSDKYSISIGAL